jgi:uncharacterized membrane protein
VFFCLFEEILLVLFLVLVPTIELRGAIPVGILVQGLDPLTVFIIATAFNILLILPIYIFLGLFFNILMKIKLFRFLVEKIRAKTTRYVEKYGFIGLAVFVGIPLPGTGAYSGVLGAYLLGIKKRKAIPAIALGVLIAGVLVTILSVLALNGFETAKIIVS